MSKLPLLLFPLWFCSTLAALANGGGFFRGGLEHINPLSPLSDPLNSAPKHLSPKANP